MKIYVDDLNVVEKISKENAVSIISQNKRLLKVHAPQTQTAFENIAVKTEEIKMKVNQSKTQMLCISASLHEDTTAYIRPRVMNAIKETASEESLKIVGFHFNSRPTVNYHVNKMCVKFRSCLWSLSKLKTAGMPQNDLLIIYKSVLRPVLEFACVTYGPMLTNELSSEIEKLQLKVMNIVYCATVSYSTVLSETNIEVLSERRNERILNFARKTLNNSRFAPRWFPKNNPHDHFTRNKNICRRTSQN